MEPTQVGGEDAMWSAKHLSCDESISGFEGAEKMRRRCVKPVDEGEWGEKKQENQSQRSVREPTTQSY